MPPTLSRGQGWTDHPRRVHNKTNASDGKFQKLSECSKNHSVKNVQEHQFKYASVEDRVSVVKFLEALSQGFSEGMLVLSLDDKQIELEPGEILDFEVSAKWNDDEARVIMKIAWKEKTRRIDAVERKMPDQADKPLL